MQAILDISFSKFPSNPPMAHSFTQSMIERMDYWRGFTGGLVAGIAIGAWMYFSPRANRKIIDSERFEWERSGDLSMHREAPESAGDPAGLIPERLNSARLDFERPSP